MPLTRDDAEKVSLLARLELSPAELETMREQLAGILEYVELLGELDTGSVEPMAHAVELTNVFRADEVRPTLPRAEALSNAPHTDGEYFLVPAVLGE